MSMTDHAASDPLWRMKTHRPEELGTQENRKCNLERRRERVRLGDAAAPIADCEREQCGCSICTNELAANGPQISQIAADSGRPADTARVWHMVLVPSMQDDDPAGVTVFCISRDEDLVQREFDRQREKFPQGVIEKVKAVEAR